MTTAPPLPITHRSVLTVAVPIMLANVTEPLIGVVNTAIIGRLPDPYYIGAISVGALIFSFMFWGFGFLRLSTGGLSAQATGAKDYPELVNVFWRALSIALVAGVIMILASPFIGKYALDLIGGSKDIRVHAETYFTYRIWSAPAALSNFCILGWFVGQGRSTIAFITQVFLNLTNMLLSAMFVLSWGMSSDGVGLAAVIAEYAACAMGLGFVLKTMGKLGCKPSLSQIFDAAKFRQTLGANLDIMIRTVCLLFAFAWFTARGARSGDLFIAANAVLFNFFEVAAYLIDGFSYASEALVGQSIGAKSRERFQRAILLTTQWAMVVGLMCSLIIWFGGPAFISLMTVNPDIQNTARTYLAWTALTPFLGALCFQFDGIFTGAMATKEMRNMMTLSLLVYLGAWYVLEPIYGNHGLWAALCIFFIVRGLTFAARMPALTKRAFAPQL
jgi:multidrug resistance protein, MATE family